MKKYNFKIIKTYHYVSAVEVEYHWTIEGDYLTAKVKYFGNQGFELPDITAKGRKNNGYFWSLNMLMKWLFSGNAIDVLRPMHETEIKEIEVA